MINIKPTSLGRTDIILPTFDGADSTPLNLVSTYEPVLGSIDQQLSPRRKHPEKV